MPKKKPRPDPLAKVSAPNLRRMVKRRDAEITRLCDRRSKLVKSYESLFKAQEVRLGEMLAERDRLAAELAAMKRQPLDAVDVTMAGDEGRRFAGGLPQVSVPLPDAAQRVVCHVAAVTEPHYWHRTIREGGEEYVGTSITADNTPAEVQVPPFGAGMPGATLTQDDVFSPHINPLVAWSRWYWNWRRSPLTCPAVADSLEGRKALLGAEAAVVWPGSFTSHRGMWTRASLLDVPVPPLTWRAA